jgi:hypothetical protein
MEQEAFARGVIVSCVMGDAAMVPGTDNILIDVSRSTKIGLLPNFTAACKREHACEQYYFKANET